MFFSFPENARWNAERQAVEFGVEIGEYQGVVRVPRRSSGVTLTVTVVPRVLRGWAGRIDRVQPALAERNVEDRRILGLSWVSAARRSSQPRSEPL